MGAGMWQQHSGGGGEASEVLPLQKGGRGEAGKVLAILKKGPPPPLTLPVINDQSLTHGPVLSGEQTGKAPTTNVLLAEKSE